MTRRTFHDWTAAFTALLCLVFSAGCPVRDGDLDPLDPNHPVVPIESGTWVIVVRESASQTPEQARMLESMLLKIQASGSEFRIYDPQDRLGDTLVVEAFGYASPVKTHGLPTLIVTSASGKVLSAGKLPATEAEAMAAIRRATR